MFLIKYRKSNHASEKYTNAKLFIRYPNNDRPKLFNSASAALQFANEIQKSKRDYFFKVEPEHTAAPIKRPDSPRLIEKVTSNKPS